MALTPVSATTPYITPTDLLNYRDWRQMADWLSITDARGSQGSFTGSAVAIEHCNAAGGLFEAAVMRGNRYQPADIQALQTQAGQSWSLVKRILAFIAIDSMSRFKKRTPADEADIEWAQEMIERLANGERILAFLEAENAGNPSTTPLNQWGSRPSRQARPFFGSRGRWGSWGAGCGGGWGDGWGC